MGKIGKDDVVFEDIKKSLTLGQFESLMELAQEDYNKLERALQAREEFEEKATKKMAEEQSEMPEKLAKKLVEGLIRAAKKEFDEIFKEELARHEDVLDFLNTFRTSKKQLKSLT